MYSETSQSHEDIQVEMATLQVNEKYMMQYTSFRTYYGMFVDLK